MLSFRQFAIPFIFYQENEAAFEQIKTDRVRTEQEEKRKTLQAETQQHNQVCSFISY